jgi:hypothetical protein
MRSSAAVVLVAAACVAGCGRAERMLTVSERKECERVAQRADSTGIASYGRAFAACKQNTLHPERGGG